MRTRTGCQACRERHLKCVRSDYAEKCQRCIENKRACFNTSQTRFRPVTHVSLKAEDDGPSRRDLTYEVDQRWVPIPTTVEFVRTVSGEDVYDDVLEEEPQRPEQAVVFAASSVLDSTNNASPTSARQAIESPAQAGALAHPRSIASPAIGSPHDLHKVGSITSLLQQSPSQASHHSYPYASPHVSTASPAITYTPSWPFATQQETRLFYHFIKHMSLWIDVCDAQSHFGRELPKRVPDNPILANAILALSSRQLSMINNTPDDVSPEYASRAVQSLISHLDDPLGHWDENLLAVVIILRLHEEISQDDDMRAHLFGQARILRAISSFAADGGLRESASWVSLRQHIYISLTKQAPLDVDLENFTHSSVFRDTSNEAYANRMIYIFATVLDYAFSDHSNSPGHMPQTARWAEIEASVENWFQTKPWYYQPLWQQGNSEQPQKNAGGGTVKVFEWPELLMIHPAQVIGYQYYWLAKIVLAIYDPKLTRLGFGSHRARKQSERTVLEGMRQIVGLSKSNDDIPNAMFQASHILSACGSYLHDESEQAAAVEFLSVIQRKLGWQTDRIIQELTAQWRS